MMEEYSVRESQRKVLKVRTCTQYFRVRCGQYLRYPLVPVDDTLWPLARKLDCHANRHENVLSHGTWLILRLSST